MRPLLLLLLVSGGLFFRAGAQTSSAPCYRIQRDSADDNRKMLVGIVTREELSGDTAFRWYADSRRIYGTPDSSAVAALQANRDRISFIIFFGTWCEDSQFIIPKFYKIAETAGFPAERITAVAVDRHRGAPGNLAHVMHITKTPTIIVLENGKETGRLEEYGKTGYWDRELAALINH